MRTSVTNIEIIFITPCLTKIDFEITHTVIIAIHIRIHQLPFDRIAGNRVNSQCFSLVITSGSIEADMLVSIKSDISKHKFRKK